MPMIDSQRRDVLFVALGILLEANMRVLILGGTTEASALMRQLAHDERFHVTLSLAGRTALQRAPTTQCRIGGFGGVPGLANWLAENCIDTVVDATHPFAVRISANAVEAARLTGIPMITAARPPWQQHHGDAWLRVDSAAAAAQALGAKPTRVLLTIGRQQVAAFRSAPQHTYIARMIEAPDPGDLPHDAEVILQRGPYELDAEVALMQARRVETLVAKNSGGQATYAKIAAARQLGLPVIMIDRPQKPAMLAVASVDTVCSWLQSQLHLHSAGLSERGV